MIIRKCREMRVDLKIEMHEKKLEKISNEIEILVSQINQGIHKEDSEITLQEVKEQLREIQDFANS